MGAAAVPLILTAVSAGANYVNQRNQQRDRERETMSAILARTERQKKADAEVQNLLQEIRTSSPDDERASLTGQYLSQLQAARGGVSNPLLQGGNSQRYDTESRDAALGVANASDAFAGLVAGLDAPILQRENENVSGNRYGTAIDLIGREQQGADYLTDLRLANIRSNPWLAAIAEIAGGAANAYGSGGFGGGTSAAAANSIGKGKKGITQWGSVAQNGASNLYRGGALS